MFFILFRVAKNSRNTIRQIRIQLDDAFLNLETTRDDNVHLKAEAEALNFKVINLGAKVRQAQGEIQHSIIREGSAPKFNPP